MASDGTGTSWDETVPANADFFKDGALEIREDKIALRKRVEKEHITFGTSTAGGEHKHGSATAYYNGSAPTLRPDGATVLDNSVDTGRLWLDGGVLKYWNGTAWVAVSATAALSVAVLQHTTSAGTSGGSITAGSWVTRTLNTEDSDPSGIVTLSGNQFTLAAGTYEIDIDAPIYASNGHQSRLYNVTDAAVAAIGSAEWAMSTSPNGQTSSRIHHVMTLSGSKTFRVETRVEANAQLGKAPSSTFGSTCVFLQVVIRKI